MWRQRAPCETPNRTGGDKPRPYGICRRGGVHPLPFMGCDLANPLMNRLCRRLTWRPRKRLAEPQYLTVDRGRHLAQRPTQPRGLSGPYTEAKSNPPVHRTNLPPSPSPSHRGASMAPRPAPGRRDYIIEPPDRRPIGRCVDALPIDRNIYETLPTNQE
jgi:hypothetical protein